MAPTGTCALVIDDDPALLRLVAALLRKNQYQVYIASTSEQALVSIKTIEPAVILVDLNLPGLQGLDLIRQMRRDPRTAGAVILAMTSSSGPDVEKNAMQAGCDGFLRKPFEAQTLLGFVQEHVHGRSDGGGAKPREKISPRVFLAQAMDQCRELLRELDQRFPNSAASQMLRKMGVIAGEFGFWSVPLFVDKAADQIDALWHDPDLLREALNSLLAALERVPVEDEQVREPVLQPEAPKSADLTSRGSPIALIIDDDPGMRRLVQAMLQRIGVACEMAENAEQGLQMVDQVSFSVLVIDVNLPGLGGFEILKLVKSRMPATRVMMLTASSDDDDMTRAFELGADDYVRKPLKPVEFLARLKRLLPR